MSEVATRSGIALCLSGGGFRAALFHLGALRRLNELGILSRADAISAVSGGSLIAAHLAARIPEWPAPGEVVADWDNAVAVPFRALAGHNLRTGPLLHRALPWNWGRPGAAVEALARLLHRRLIGTALADLPARPRFVFSAADMIFGTNWVFERTRLGDFQAGYAAPDADWPVAWAVAASACFPPVFDPMRPRLDPARLRGGRYRGADRADLIGGMQLTDGGVYDNMALEPVWKRHRTLLVSDGGALFDYASSGNALQRLLRYPAIVGKQALAIRRRWLIAGIRNGTIDGAYWGIGSARKADAPAYSPALVEDVIRMIRTDLDAFSDAEIAVLENHGYFTADRVVRTYAPALIVHDDEARAPFPAWLDEGRVRDALRGSDRRTLLGRHRS